MKKSLLALVLLSMPAAACGPSFGPEIFVWIAGILFLLAIPHFLAPVIGMAVARRPGYRLSKKARFVTFLGGCVVSLMALFLLQSWPGYWLGMLFSGMASVKISRGLQMQVSELPDQLGFNRAL